MNTATRDALLRTFSGLVEGFSLHAQVANRAWLLLAVVSVLGVTQAAAPMADMNIPLLDAKVGAEWFCVVTALVCAALFVAWTTCLVQCDRIRFAAEGVLEKMDAENRGDTPLTLVDPRFFWDAQRRPGTLFMASVPMALPSSLALPRAVYYTILKLFAVAVHFGLPVLAVWVLLRRWHLRNSQDPWQAIGAVAAAFITALQFLIACWMQFRYWRRALRPVVRG